MPNFVYKNHIIEYSLSRNAKKNVNFRIKGNGEVCISAPPRVSKSELEKMILEKAEWILINRSKVLEKKSNLSKIQIENGSHIFLNGNRKFIKIISENNNKVFVHENMITLQIKEKYINSTEYINNYFESWIKELTYNICDKMIDKYLIKLEKYNLTKPELTIRTMNSRWGSCIPTKNKITLNKNLIYPPIECLEYVVLHELSHLIEANHSKNFYKIIENIMPDWKERKKILNNF